MPKLYKTTVVIWSDYDPAARGSSLENLAREAGCGDSYCSKMESQTVNNPETDPDWDNTEFFDDDDS